MKENKDYRPRINISRTLPNPSEYVLAMENEFREHAFSEERAPQNKSKWRLEIFKQSADYPVDVEIGTGAGYFFAHYANSNPNRGYVGFELKYKPLIQSIRRALVGGATNAKICRYAAQNLDEIFADGEINNVFIHFPDPWTSPKKPARRIFNRTFLRRLHSLQRPDSLIEFKTDSAEYFEWAQDELAAIQDIYEVIGFSRDLHNSEFASQNFVTGFERIFIKQGLKINYALLRRK